MFKDLINQIQQEIKKTISAHILIMCGCCKNFAVSIESAKRRNWRQDLINNTWLCSSCSNPSGWRQYKHQVECIKHDGAMFEHEHADHPDYKFPITVEFTGDISELDNHDNGKEIHAVIYCDGYIIVTLYECLYCLWSVNDGKVLGEKHWWNSDWKITDKDLEKIKSNWKR